MNAPSRRNVTGLPGDHVPARCPNEYGPRGTQVRGWPAGIEIGRSAAPHGSPVTRPPSPCRAAAQRGRPTPTSRTRLARTPASRQAPTLGSRFILTRERLEDTYPLRRFVAPQGMLSRMSLTTLPLLALILTMSGRIPAIATDVMPPPSLKQSLNAQPAATQAGRPILECDEPVHDFGRVRGGEDIRHSFRVRNVSDEVVWIRIAESISGTRPRDERRLEPGQATDITVTMITRNFHGPFTKTTTVRVVPPP
mgnify:CR=1 FL=1